MAMIQATPTPTPIPASAAVESALCSVILVGAVVAVLVLEAAPVDAGVVVLVSAMRTPGLKAQEVAEGLAALSDE